MRKLIGLLAAVILMPMTVACANNTKPLLTLDARNAPQLPRNFRMATDIEPDMRIAGGAQFSEMGLTKIIERLGGKKVTIIDLRQESHGFLNSNAISWYGSQDAANAGKTATQINADQMTLLLGLLGKQSVNVNQVLKKSLEGTIESVKPVEFAVHQVSSESELASKYHLPYYRLYVQDFHAPSDDQVDQFIKTIRQLPKTQWIYIHCHAGVGRTTTFMAMFDMMRHAKNVSFDEILKRQRSIGGKDLRAMPEETSFKYEDSQERLAFLQKFYDYARANNDNFETLWSEPK